jgi:hypothetical protein
LAGAEGAAAEAESLIFSCSTSLAKKASLSASPSSILAPFAAASETLPNETHVLHKMVLDYQSTVDQLSRPSYLRQ